MTPTKYHQLPWRPVARFLVDAFYVIEDNPLTYLLAGLTIGALTS